MIKQSEVAELLVMMQQYDRFIDATPAAVIAWHGLLSPAIASADDMRAGMLHAFRTIKGRVTPAHIIEAAQDAATLRNPTRRVVSGRVPE